MQRNIEQTLIAASKRPLSNIEIERLTASIRALESQVLPREDVLVKRIKELESKLTDCHARIRKCERNGCPD